jgi:hypothetical protein
MYINDHHAMTSNVPIDEVINSQQCISVQTIFRINLEYLAMSGQCFPIQDIEAEILPIFADVPCKLRVWGLFSWLFSTSAVEK